MTKRFFTALMAAASLVLMSSAGFAEEKPVTDDGFGGAPYFTAQTPDALGDVPVGNALAASGKDDSDDAQAVSKIEPAAGGDDHNVFTLPEDPSAPAAAQPDGVLKAPIQPIVPGTIVDKKAQ